MENTPQNSQRPLVLEVGAVQVAFTSAVLEVGRLLVDAALHAALWPCRLLEQKKLRRITKIAMQSYDDGFQHGAVQAYNQGLEEGVELGFNAANTKRQPPNNPRWTDN